MTNDSIDNDPLRTRLKRSTEALEGAQSELVAGRANNAVNWAYYSCFHVGVALRVLSGDQPERVERGTGRNLWTHGGTMDRLGEILLDRGVATMPILGFHALMGVRMRADYHADQPGAGVSLELAQGAVLQALRLRDVTNEMLPWVGQDNG
jgi:uncharacterized protein (UPF0332 family)